jgi:hypothetical protein
LTGEPADGMIGARRTIGNWLMIWREEEVNRC